MIINRSKLRGQELTQREIQICNQVCLGITNREIAYNLSLNYKTIKNHLGRVFCKLRIKNRTQIPSFFTKRDIIELTPEQKREKYMKEGSFPIVEEYLRNHPEVKEYGK
jgi:DNA-binding CsgD family transcriptional regulator